MEQRDEPLYIPQDTMERVALMAVERGKLGDLLLDNVGSKLGPIAAASLRVIERCHRGRLQWPTRRSSKFVAPWSARSKSKWQGLPRKASPTQDCWLSPHLRPRTDVEHSHHLVVLVGQDVAVPHVAAGLVEGCLDPGDLAGQRRDHVLRGILDVLDRFRHVCRRTSGSSA